ncbi:MAG: hypothetical protein JWR09_746 [Mucilaginibacter sp.]|nr:hypothetical protein [Mucilaginibacter sp.]
MNFITIQLQQFVRESISPQRFIGKQISSDEFIKWKNFVEKEIASVNPAVLNSKLHKRDIAVLISQAVDLSNTVNSYVFKRSSILRNHIQASVIKEHYNYTLCLFEGLIKELNDLFPNEAGAVKISNPNLFETISSLKMHYYKLDRHLQNSDIEKDLLDIVMAGILKLIRKKNITRNDTLYINSLITFLLDGGSLNNQQLTDLLIIHDFNTPNFYLYNVNSWKNRLEDIPGLHEQREMLLLEKDRLYNLFIEKGLVMPFIKKSLFIELDEFLNEKYSVTKQMVKLTRKLIQDNEKTKAGTRFLINMPVAQFGLFIRIQIEKGLLVKENIGELFKFFATHFYTPNALYISADSLQKKSTDVEFATAQKLKAQLIAMLNWLNTTYNLSNYN